ncbi:MAG: 1,4-dihydroxy-2-naphthoate octaprenyltransferase [Flavobacteriaceae bacterium]
MASLKHYVQAARLRTLPLSVSGIIVGSGLAASEGKFNVLIFVLAILTTVGFQVLSNFANDYGDGIKGTDADREGEQRLIAAGLITPKQMKEAIVYTIVVTMAIAVVLIYSAFGKDEFFKSLVFLFLGIISIYAAIKYTVGKSAYGYSGLGDVFVFLFFGLLSVIGSYYLFTHSVISWTIIWPASAIGMLSSAVLNLNNMRDQIHDKKVNKNTLVVKIGSRNAKIYHAFLIIGALFSLVIFRVLSGVTSYSYWVFLIAFIPLLANLVVVFKTILFKDLDGELKKVALATFFCALLFCLPYFV